MDISEIEIHVDMNYNTITARETARAESTAGGRKDMKMPNAGEIIERLARENERQKIEIEQLKHKLYLAEMERDLLKKLDEIERRDAFRK